MADLAGDFLPPGSLVVSVTDGDGDQTWLRAQGPCLYSFPLVVLVDNGTASAAELFAGSMKSHGRAVLVGEATLGKGSAQALIPAPDGGAHYATTAICELPNGEAVQGTGVTPDIERRGLSRPPPPGFFEEVYPGAKGRGGGAITSSF
jgi:carboxyl-terminal processing protease